MSFFDWYLFILWAALEIVSGSWYWSITSRRSSSRSIVVGKSDESKARTSVRNGVGYEEYDDLILKEWRAEMVPSSSTSMLTLEDVCGSAEGWALDYAIICSSWSSLYCIAINCSFWLTELESIYAVLTARKRRSTNSVRISFNYIAFY